MRVGGTEEDKEKFNEECACRGNEAQQGGERILSEQRKGDRSDDERVHEEDAGIPVKEQHTGHDAHGRDPAEERGPRADPTPGDRRKPTASGDEDVVIHASSLRI